MNVKLASEVKDLDQMNYTITVPKYIIGRLVDYFMFNTDDAPYFDGDGVLEGIEGVPNPFVDLLSHILRVEMDANDWQIVLSYVRSGYSRETVMREVNDLLEEKGLNGMFAVQASPLEEEC
jgi:hypothetical protein